MRLWRSVVGKLWMTIVALVSLVLVILTILLLQFFEKYHVTQIETGLTEQAEKFAAILTAHEHDEMGEEIVFEVIDEPVEVVIAYNPQRFVYSPSIDDKNKIPEHLFLQDKNLSKVFSQKETVVQEISMFEDAQYKGSRFDHFIVAGAPFKLNNQEEGAIYIYQSLEAMKETTKQTTRLIFLAAGIGIILTTFFAFFLSTRITSPLLIMKEAAFELSKGKFDKKVPFLSHDEIGELAIAFNQMGKRLKFNMDVLSQEKEQLSSILSSMADGVVTFSQSGTILIKNPPAENFLQQWHFENETDEEMPPELEQLLHSSIQTESEQIGEIQLMGRTYVIIISPLYTQNQESVRGAVAVIRDMTEERRMDKLRIDFVSNVSHELRTPISMLQGYSEAIIDDIAGSPEENKELAKIIYDESLRIGRLVNELLDLARMEAGHISLNVEDIDVEPYMERVLYKFKGVAQDNQLQLHLTSELTTKNWKLDADRIEQVLTNLINNAIRHTHENGEIQIELTENEKGLVVAVKDNGVGIPEEDLPFVFERFYKADKARTRGEAGTGLGLAIVKNIIDAHNGSIHVQSKIGIGTVFSFIIPKS